MVYNRKRHLELLQRNKECNNLGKIFYKEEPENYLELLSYDAAISEYVQWENRFKLASLMEKFLNQTITVDEFQENFFLYIKNVNNLSNKLILDLDSKEFEDFNPDFLRYPGYTNLSMFLLVEVDNFDEDSDYEEFYRAVKNISWISKKF